MRRIAALRPTLDVPENVAKCLREKWPPAARACIGRATSTRDVTGCMTGREQPDPRPADRDDAERGGATKVTAAPSSGPSPDEARLNLNSIEKANVAWLAEEGSFVVGAAGLTPAASCCSSPGGRCTATPADWGGVWRQLSGFEMSKPFAFRYSYQSDGQTYEARAVGDLDCDGTAITYTLRGRLTDAGPVAELIEPTNAD